MELLRTNRPAGFSSLAVQLRRLTCLFLSVPLFAQQNESQPADLPIHLQVLDGTPLRVYITKRVWFRKGTAVTAQTIEPLWAFDRIVVPAGTTVEGRISSFKSITGMVRANAILNGDFTPLKRALVEFTDLKMADGRTIAIHSQAAVGLPTTYVPPRNRKAWGSTASATTDPNVPQSLRRKVQQQVQQNAQAQIGGRLDSVIDFVRGQNKKEWLEESLLQKLPYHPQWYRARTRFDAVLEQPIDFGDSTVPGKSLGMVSELPSLPVAANVRLLSSLTSADAKPGDPIKGVLSEPVFSSDGKLLFPVGTQFTGKITLAQKARFFHRGGKLRFVYESVDIPGLAGLDIAKRGQAVQAQLTGVEANPAALKVDAEGTAKATESKTRLIRPIIAGLIAQRAADNDADRHGGVSSNTGNANGNLGGRALGGFSGLGLLGTAASFGPRGIGVGLGYFGLARSVYVNLISKGAEVHFEPNTAMQMKLGVRAPIRSDGK